MMYMVTRTNHERIDAMPPGLDYEVEDKEHMKVLIENGKRNAWMYDIYNDVLQVSWLYGGQGYHFIWCDAEPKVINEGGRVISVSDSEHDVIRDSLQFVSSVHREVGGTVTQEAVFAGWEIKERMWPRLVNKAFAYRLPVPFSLMSDPMRTHQTTNYLLSLDHIYTQGRSYNRRLTSLADVLTYWNYGDRDKYPTPETLADAICTDPVKAATIAEIYLQDMHKVTLDYYGITQQRGE